MEAQKPFSHGRLTAIFLLLLVFLAPKAEAIDVLSANQVTVGWGRPATMADGATPIAAEDVIEYELYRKKPGGLEEAAIGTTQETSYTITMELQGIWYFGVAARKVISETDPESGEVLTGYGGWSEIAWSNQAQYCKDGKTFAVVFIKQPGPPNAMYPSYQGGGQ